MNPIGHCAFAVVLSLAVNRLAAQDPRAPAPAPGDRVRVTSADRRATGTLESIDGDTIVVRRSNGALTKFARAPRPRLDVSTGAGMCGQGRRAACVIGGFLGSIRGYVVPPFVRDDYLASYEGDRLTRSAALVRASPKDLAALAPQLASIEVPVAIVVGRNDPYGLARDAALLRERLPHARLDVLEAGHCVWEERAPEFESIVTQWVRGGHQ